MGARAEWEREGECGAGRADCGDGHAGAVAVAGGQPERGRGAACASDGERKLTECLVFIFLYCGGAEAYGQGFGRGFLIVRFCRTIQTNRTATSWLCLACDPGREKKKKKE